MRTVESIDTLQIPEMKNPFIYAYSAGEDILPEGLEGMSGEDPDALTAILERADSLAEQMVIEDYQRLERVFGNRPVRSIGVFQDLEAAA